MCSTLNSERAGGDTQGPGIGRHTRDKKAADPRQGTSGVRLVVPPQFAIPSRERPSSARHSMRCGGSITGADWSGGTSRRRLLNRRPTPIVRGGAPRAYPLAFPVPLRSDCGSLAHSRQGLVLILASLFGCGGYGSNWDGVCQSLDGSGLPGGGFGLGGSRVTDRRRALPWPPGANGATDHAAGVAAVGVANGKSISPGIIRVAKTLIGIMSSRRTLPTASRMTMWPKSSPTAVNVLSSSLTVALASRVKLPT